MTGAYVRLKLEPDRVVDLGPGDIIGRLHSATLRLNEPEISEAHAMVSLRGEQLVLLALRGLLSVGGRPTAMAVLRPGAVILLSRSRSILVVGVELPDEVLALEGAGMGAPEVLRRSTYSLQMDGTALRVTPRFLPEALAHLWSTPEGWFFQEGSAAPRSVQAGDALMEGARLVALPLERGGVAPTSQVGGLFAPMRIIARYETVHFHREGQLPVQISGLPARLLSELVGFASPTPWRLLAEQLWPGVSDPTTLRQRLDRSLAKLRHKMRKSGLRADLVRASGSGDYELLLYPGDEAIDDS